MNSDNLFKFGKFSKAFEFLMDERMYMTDIVKMGICDKCNKYYDKSNKDFPHPGEGCLLESVRDIMQE